MTEPIIGAQAHVHLGVDAEAVATRARRAWATYHREGEHHELTEY